jgi:hypothetical protein
LASQNLIGTPDLDEALIGQLGNLILVSEELNGKLGSKPFKDKRRILIESGYKLPAIIEEATNWGAKEIKNRTDQMASEAYDSVWRL